MIQKRSSSDIVPKPQSTSKSKLKQAEENSQSRPAATLHPRHRGKVSHNQTFLVRRETLNSHTLPSHVDKIRPIYGGVGLDFHRGNIVLCSNETKTLSFAPVLIQDETMSGIAVGRRSLDDMLALMCALGCSYHLVVVGEYVPR